MATGTTRILILNGSLRGDRGNSHALVQYAQTLIAARPDATSAVLTLAAIRDSVEAVYEQLCGCDGLLVVSGVYWNSWSSPMQRFVEVATAFEQSPAFWGKPVACAVSMDSVGGVEVAARIHGTFSGLGCWSPPCSTLVVSRVGQEAIQASQGKPDDPNDDVWRPEDLETVIGNLLRAAAWDRTGWQQWPHVGLQPLSGPWPGQGELDMGTPLFL
ncbi:flavodoxin family protein [Taibaiella koreensis]|uniref:flavodoxin family protein n=1 Tax=Taibaiella koreensis TaxID=1268548 RepID=UPI000E59C79B|nr:NAD(P)H-dependent oxidoreductase [Taibaiella koreensis]